MANDKREQMKRAIEQGLDHWHVMVGSGNLTNIGTVHDLKALVAAATAEGIPQADGWVDVADGIFPKTADPVEITIHDAECEVTYTVFGSYETLCEMPWRDDNGNQLEHAGGCSVIAWREKSAPYQRQSSEGE